MRDERHFADTTLDPNNPTRCMVVDHYAHKTMYGEICGRSLMGEPKFDVRTDEGEILLNIEGKYIVPENEKITLEKLEISING